MFMYNESMYEKCPFCGCGRVLEQNELACVLASDPRLTFGHLLVIPKRHVERPWEMSDNEMLAVWGFIKKYQKLLAERVGEGCDVRENYRPFLIQNRLKVDHLHWHLIPRRNEDEIYTRTQTGEKDLFRNLVSDELDEIRKTLGFD